VPPTGGGGIEAQGEGGKGEPPLTEHLLIVPLVFCESVAKEKTGGKFVPGVACPVVRVLVLAWPLCKARAEGGRRGGEGEILHRRQRGGVLGRGRGGVVANATWVEGRLVVRL
jgi:hypothetical protein